jgi:hypothetical protein
MFNQLKRWFRKWNELGCYKCGCKTVHMANEDYMGYTLMEYDELCDKCNTVVNHWAYGYFEPPTTKTEYFKIITLVQWKLWWKEWLKTKY